MASDALSEQYPGAKPAQVEQTPSHFELQQTPDAQKPLSHCSGATHDWPNDRLPGPASIPLSSPVFGAPPPSWPPSIGRKPGITRRQDVTRVATVKPAESRGTNFLRQDLRISSTLAHCTRLEPRFSRRLTGLSKRHPKLWWRCRGRTIQTRWKTTNSSKSKSVSSSS